MAQQVAGRTAREGRASRELRIPDLKELLSIPTIPEKKVQDSAAINLMADKIVEFLNRTMNKKDLARLEQDLEELRSFRLETLEAIEAAYDLKLDPQVVAHQREYASRIPLKIVLAAEETCKSIIHCELGFLARIWGREVDSKGFHAQPLKGTGTVRIPLATLKLIRDKVNAHQDKIPFKQGLVVMVKGKDPFIVMKARCGAIEVLIAIDQWE